MEISLNPHAQATLIRIAIMFGSNAALVACEAIESIPVKIFKVFGEPVAILTTAEMTGGKSSAMTQVSPPGGGPPPHRHTNEDETFFVLKGEYEFLSDGEWRKVERGETVHAMRGSVHTFRNAGASAGKMLVFVVPGGFEKYLEEISRLSVPEDMPQVLEISERYGISFPQA